MNSRNSQTNANEDHRGRRSDSRGPARTRRNDNDALRAPWCSCPMQWLNELRDHKRYFARDRSRRIEPYHDPKWWQKGQCLRCGHLCHQDWKNCKHRCFFSKEHGLTGHKNGICDLHALNNYDNSRTSIHPGRDDSQTGDASICLPQQHTRNDATSVEEPIPVKLSSDAPNYRSNLETIVAHDLVAVAHELLKQREISEPRTYSTPEYERALHRLLQRDLANHAAMNRTLGIPYDRID